MNYPQKHLFIILFILGGFKFSNAQPSKGFMKFINQIKVDTRFIDTNIYLINPKASLLFSDYSHTDSSVYVQLSRNLKHEPFKFVKQVYRFDYKIKNNISDYYKNVFIEEWLFDNNKEALLFFNNSYHCIYNSTHLKCPCSKILLKNKVYFIETGGNIQPIGLEGGKMNVRKIAAFLNQLIE